ncbi:MAG TPA: indole-3-glycerol phosphate synthase TrpC [Vicinamibacterales bacterium]|nr:indole-3-glycerol phosphate synthase TrpC [Vicinamibacterales bacterium]
MSAPRDVLATILASVRAGVEIRRSREPVAALERRAAARLPRGDAFVAALAAPGPNVIAECKRRSPSRGILRADYDPATIAAAYRDGGAAAVSVLTEPAFFGGSLEHLAAVRTAIDLPLLRKDFIVSEYQVLEARAAGADAVLVIVAALDAASLRRLLGCARDCGLAAMVEVHDLTELAVALDAGAAVIGVNARNLATLRVEPRVALELIPAIPAAITPVAESGIRGAEDVRRLRAAGYRAFLVGERLMTAPAPGEALAVLLEGAA